MLGQHPGAVGHHAFNNQVGNSLQETDRVRHIVFDCFANRLCIDRFRLVIQRPLKRGPTQALGLSTILLAR